MDTEILAHQAGEPVDAAGVFKAKGEWFSQMRPLLRFARRAVGRGTLADRCMPFNILAATPTRVIWWTAEYGAGGPVPTALAGEWPRNAVTAESRKFDKVLTGTGSGVRTHDIKLIRLQLRTPDGPMTIDLQDNREERKLVKALR